MGAAADPAIATLLALVVLVTCVGLAAVTSQWRRAEHHRRMAVANLGEAERQRQDAVDARDEAKGRQREAEEARQNEKRERDRAEAALAQAEEALAEAKRQQEAAQKSQLAEEAQRTKAEEARKQASASEAKAEQERGRAEERSRAARRQLYATHMNQAMQAFRAGDTERVRELLSQHTPEADEGDFRGFEWYYLRRQCGPKPFRGDLVHGGIDYRNRFVYRNIPISSDDRTVVLSGVLCDITTGKSGEAHIDGRYGFSFAPDDQTGVTVSKEGTLALLDLDNGNTMRTFEARDMPPLPNGRYDGATPAFSPDGKTVGAHVGRCDQALGR